MRTRVEPEIIPPEDWPRHRQQKLRDEELERLATLLDDLFRIPGTNLRFGLDPLLGLLPGLGDLISGALGLLMVLAAWQRNLPRVTIWRMLVNLAIDSALGSIPLAGDFFDVAWKANRKNLALLKRSARREPAQQTWRDWLFLAGIVVAVAAMVAVPVIVLILIARALR
ncbi:MAG TPA: DUF4112 domain-containing protein [Terriglobales bacterium]|nr:DUF4112 domain-containing protein [Terriglobales bacterium]